MSVKRPSSLRVRCRGWTVTPSAMFSRVISITQHPVDAIPMQPFRRGLPDLSDARLDAELVTLDVP